MKEVSFLLTNGVLKPSSLFTAIEVFEKANQFYTERGERPFYKIEMVGSDLTQHLQNSYFSIQATRDIKSVGKTDCIIIPATEYNKTAIRDSSEMIAWIVQQYKEGAEIASLCTGAFLLAATGLLNGKECSTHWKAQEAFMQLFPDLQLCTDKVITDSNGIYTAGGGLSSLNLVLYLVEKYNGREVALYCAKLLQIDIDRHSQSPFIIFSGQKEHHDEEIKMIQDFIETNIEEKMSVDQLADRCDMNRVNFSRRFKRATRTSPIEYIQRVKMEAAKRSLESGRKNVNEVMYSVGYVDIKAFRNTFKKVTGITPWEYKTKFGQA
ncbi:helix-turn-helix domain-containing protein [Chitinophaga agrisoli]|uniref:Helix-turn-helix domain-containing protein n=1 Tax=Chitinophaga agrisoli TaxID=2607653 RepID=A0A5B2VRD2_9BACT|nr:helix-turn-helix domain-containing protein [Chitinophaga agrisoli]KAA2240699.1 helix-turn-helix domain-containing protein [Chitinophaga agrisoli]